MMNTKNGRRSIKIRFNPAPQKWMAAGCYVPDNNRDVLGIVRKPIVVKLGQPPQMRLVPEVVCFDGGYWYDDPNPKATVLYWAELPTLPDVANKNQIDEDAETVQ